jgi:hypothetical protein
MWPSIARARRRIGDVLTSAPANGTAAPGAASDPAAGTATTPATSATAPTSALEDVVIVLDGHDLEALQDALATTLDIGDRPDTPARLGTALSALIRARGGTEVPQVIRLPAGLSTPEAWEIRFDAVEPRTCEAIREATRTGSFES